MTLSTTSPGDEREALIDAWSMEEHGFPDQVWFSRKEVLAILDRSTVQQVGAEWISIHERLPELGQSVALINVDRWENTGGDLEMNVRACGYLHEMRPGDPYWSIRGERANCLDAFTHWLPLPSPKSEQGNQQ